MSQSTQTKYIAPNSHQMIRDAQHTQPPKQKKQKRCCNCCRCPKNQKSNNTEETSSVDSDTVFILWWCCFSDDSCLNFNCGDCCKDCDCKCDHDCDCNCGDCNCCDD